MTDFRILRHLLRLLRADISIGTAYRQTAKDLELPVNRVVETFLKVDNVRVDGLTTTPRGLRRMAALGAFR